MNSELVRNSLKLFTAAFITAGVALWTERIEFVWYPLVAVVVVVDDNDEHTTQAASNRILGTATVSYTHLRAHETTLHLVCRLLLEKKK